MSAAPIVAASKSANAAHDQSATGAYTPASANPYPRVARKPTSSRARTSGVTAYPSKCSLKQVMPDLAISTNPHIDAQ